MKRMATFRQIKGAGDLTVLTAHVQLGARTRRLAEVAAEQLQEMIWLINGSDRCSMQANEQATTQSEVRK
jgi:hypothetical protein